MTQIRRLLLSIPGKLASRLPGKGLSKLPLVSIFNAFFFHHLNPNGLVLVDVQGSKMYVDSRDTGVAPYLIEWGYYEKNETELFKVMVKKGMVVLDIGANIGYYTLLAARLVGIEGKVFAFEPDPYNSSLLYKNIEVNGYTNIVLVQKAVFSWSGKMELFLDKKNLGGHSLSMANVNKGNSIITEVTRIDDFFKNSTFKIDLVKMDVQGLEMKVIEGMGNVIKENKGIKIIFEFWPWGLQNADSSPRAFLNKLVEYGFKLYEIEPYLKPVSINQLLNSCIDKKFTTLYCTRA